MARPPPRGVRAGNRRRVAAGLVGLVALSAVLSAAYGGATLLEIGLLGVVGAVAGGLLVVAIGARP